MTQPRRAIHGPDRAHGRPQRADGADRRRARGAGRLRPQPRPDCVPADRGPGLFPDRSAASRRRLARAHDTRPRRSYQARAGATRGRQGGRHRRARRHQRQRQPRQRRHRLRHPQGLVGARQEGGPARSLSRPLRAREDARRRYRARDPAAADPGHRQRLGRHHEGRAARRQLRLRPARAPRAGDRRARLVAVGVPGRAQLVPRRRAPAQRDDRQGQVRDARRAARQRARRAQLLRRLHLRRAVQQVRPGVPDLRAGGGSGPPAVRSPSRR